MAPTSPLYLPHSPEGALTNCRCGVQLCGDPAAPGTRPTPGAVLGGRTSQGSGSALSSASGTSQPPGLAEKAKGATEAEPASADPDSQPKAGASGWEQQSPRGPRVPRAATVGPGADGRRELTLRGRRRDPRPRRPGGTQLRGRSGRPQTGVRWRPPHARPHTAPYGGWEWEAVREGECGSRRGLREGLTFPAGCDAGTASPGRRELEEPEATGAEAAEAAVAAAAAASGSAYLPAAILTPLPPTPPPCRQGRGWGDG